MKGFEPRLTEIGRFTLSILFCKGLLNFVHGYFLLATPHPCCSEGCMMSARTGNKHYFTTFLPENFYKFHSINTLAY